MYITDKRINNQRQIDDLHKDITKETEVGIQWQLEYVVYVLSCELGHQDRERDHAHSQQILQLSIIVVMRKANCPLWSFFLSHIYPKCSSAS